MDNRQQSMFNWDEFINYMKNQFSSMDGQPWLERADKNKNLIEGYVQKVTKSIFSELTPFASTGIVYDIFESHRFIFVKCRVPKDASIDDIRFRVNNRKLLIEYSGELEEINLPNDVNPNRSTAKLKDGLLEIRLPKSEDLQPFREIPIRN